jgi:hypothetical protein
MRIFLLRLFRPLFLHKLRKLEAFEGSESYAQQNEAAQTDGRFQSMFVVNFRPERWEFISIAPIEVSQSKSTGIGHGGGFTLLEPNNPMTGSGFPGKCVRSLGD